MAYFTMKHNWTAFALLLLTFQVVSGQRVRVDLEVEAYPMETINLRCTFASGGTSTKLTQVSWIFEATEGKRENIAVFHPQYGESFPTTSFSNRVKFTYGSLENPSIEISDMKMSDAGKYTCEFATYPSGNEQATTSVVMLANPKNSGTPVTVTAGSAPVVVATCEAAQGKPAATINWVSSASGTPNTTSKAEPDGTVTVRSEYRMVPTAADNGQDISCEITQRTQDKPQVFPMKLSVEYPPVVKIEGYDDNWYKGRTDAGLTCQADANPKADVTWRVASGEVPATVQLDGSRLMVKKVDDNTNTTFVCEAKNKLGSTKAELATFVRETRRADPPPATAGIIGGIIAAIIVLCLIGAGIFIYRKRRQSAENGDAPPKHKPPPPMKSGSSTEMLNKAHDPSTHEAQPLSQLYYETSGEPVTDLDACDDNDNTTSPANGGGPTVWNNSAHTHNPDDTGDNAVPYMDSGNPPDGHYASNEDLPAANVARGESFMSAPMLV
ncbi:PVR cell adhesion molecule related 2 like [Denticeps clupeoides]|uniref:Ig-like domain-containing protein n=1 Tax=Denticeps clupeoides TaxID=299321 RepID=A0AAY4CSN4_9TELE|nr:nectin-2-like [Denticeps clupeoides]